MLRGIALPPPYNMHVDDNLYADVIAFIFHTIFVSVAALFYLLGWPTNPLVPSPLSMDKFHGSYNHERKLVGRHFDSRRLTVGMLPHKRERLLGVLRPWVHASSYDLFEIAHLLGVLENHTKYARWARCWYFSLQNHARRALFTRYQILARRYKREEHVLRFSRQLPASLLNRVDSLISRDQAQLLWSTRQRFAVDDAMLEAVQHLLVYVELTDSPWEVPLGMIIPRDPHFWSRGDASLVGGGAYCPGLRFWFDISWSPAVLHGIHEARPGTAGYVHINALEFIVIILQLAGIKTRLESASPQDLLSFFPDFPMARQTSQSGWERRITPSPSLGKTAPPLGPRKAKVWSPFTPSY
jgi:hypothetical protein